jgi:hypothetical protein
MPRRRAAVRPLVGPLGNALALILGHGGKEGDEPAAERRREIEVGLVQDLEQGAARVDAFDDLDAVHH